MDGEGKLVIHIAITPLVGAPMRIVEALNQFTDYEARLITLYPDFYGKRTHPGDLVWGRDRVLSLELLRKADIVHIHHYFDIEKNNPFQINFRKTVHKRCRFIRQFHSPPAVYNKKNPDNVLNDKLPQLVIPNFHERLFVHARVVPNILYDEGMKPAAKGKCCKIVHATSLPNTPAWKSRWNTKGTPEISRILKTLSRKISFDYEIIAHTPFLECMQKKADADIIIDDLVTGSYHLNALEGLALGKATLSYVDQRADFVLRKLTGSDNLPFINVPLEHSASVLKELIENPDKVKKAGELGKEWFDTYYRAEKMIAHFAEAYDDLLVSEEHFRKKTKKIRETLRYPAIDVSDAIRESRKKQYAPLSQKLEDYLRAHYLKEIRAVKRFLRLKFR